MFREGAAAVGGKHEEQGEKPNRDADRLGRLFWVVLTVFLEEGAHIVILQQNID